MHWFDLAKEQTQGRAKGLSLNQGGIQPHSGLWAKSGRLALAQPDRRVASRIQWAQVFSSP